MQYAEESGVCGLLRFESSSSQVRVSPQHGSGIFGMVKMHFGANVLPLEGWSGPDSSQ